ncbi:hypothetical protein BGY98DRAFT_59171 [Russula aff. rugulosa BPL654]|nr:hypothetical protein BGY98DRAFT_59171 [Russula aff. rugulosa BPL654]
MLYPLSPSSFLLRLKALPSFGAHLLGPLLVSPAILLCPMPPLQGLRHILSAFRALPTSLSRSRRSVLVFAPFVLCTLTITVTATFDAQTTTQSIRPDACPYPHPSNGHGDSCPPTFTVSVNNTRTALEAVSVLVLRCISPLVRRRRAAVARAVSDNHISSQALTAIILCSAIGFCVLVGCLLQLPAAYITLRNRYFRSRRTGTPIPSSNSVPGLFDVEMGDLDTGSLDCSPPPPYSRAPSYESCRDRDNNTSTGGRGECQSTS